MMKEILPFRERGISFSRVGLSKEAVIDAIALDLVKSLEASTFPPPLPLPASLAPLALG